MGGTITSWQLVIEGRKVSTDCDAAHWASPGQVRGNCRGDTGDFSANQALLANMYRAKTVLLSYEARIWGLCVNFLKVTNMYVQKKAQRKRLSFVW
jgi:hypothetical protein